MKGLVRKDLKLLAKMDNRIFVIVLYAFAISIAYFGNADIYALQSTLFFSLFLGMHLMMTLTYDGMSSWKEYEMTLPLSVKQIVGSKYLSCLAVLPVSLIGTIVIYLIRWIVYHTFPADLFRISMMFAVIMPLLWCSLCLALAQWISMEPSVCVPQIPAAFRSPCSTCSASGMSRRKRYIKARLPKRNMIPGATTSPRQTFRGSM